MQNRFSILLGFSLLSTFLTTWQSVVRPDFLLVKFVVLFETTFTFQYLVHVFALILGYILHLEGAGGCWQSNNFFIHWILKDFQFGVCGLFSL